MSIGSTLTSVAFPPPAGGVGVALPKRRPRTQSVMLAEAQMAEVASLDFAGGTAAVFTTPSPGKITPNEDVAGLFSVGLDHGVLVVADGLGGHADGEQASRLAVEAFHDTIRAAAAAANGGEQLRPAILNGIEAANDAVMELGGGAATTMALVEIQGRTIR